MKRWISLFLALLLLLQTPIGVLAAEPDQPTFRVETVAALPGDSGVKVNILAENNPGIASAKLIVNFDDVALDLTNVEYNTEWGGMSQPPQYYTSPLTLNWFNGVADVAHQQSVYATLTFNVADDAVVGTSEINVSYNPEDVYNITENNVEFRIVNGGIDIGTSATPPSTDPPENPPSDPTPDGQPMFRVETKTVNPGDTAVVNIWAEDNPGIASAKLMVDYDDSRLTLNGVVFNAQWGGMSQPPQTLESPITLNWFNGTTDYKETDSVFATLSFSVLKNAEEGLASVEVTYNPEDVYNINEDNQNFAITNGGITVAMNDPVPPSVVAPVAKSDLVYNGAEQTLISAGSTNGGTMKYALGANGTTAPTTGFGTKLPVGTAAGTYYVWYYVDGGANYESTAKACVSVTIAKAKVTKPAADTTVFTYSGKVQTYSVASSALYTVSGNTRTNAGTQTVTVALKDTANYEWADGTTAAVMFDFTVDRKAITVRAEAKSKVYGANEPALTYFATGLVSGDSLIGELSREAGGSVGTYAITQGTVTNENNPNYNITFVGADFTITKEHQPPLVIVGKPVAPIAYGDSFVLSVTGGAGDGDVTWAVTEGEQYAKIDASGKVTVKGVGTVKITVTKAESLNYGVATTAYEFTSVKATPVLGAVTCSGIVKDTTAPADVVLSKTAGPKGMLRITDGAMLANQSEYHWTFTPDDTNNYNVVTGTVEIDVVDTQTPTASIKVEMNEWSEKLNDITFGIFFKEAKQVKITYADNENGSGLKETLYHVSTEAITDFTDIQWSAYTSAFNIDPDGAFVIYAKATDNDGNSIIVNSDGIVLDATAPILQGIADSETYYGDITFKIEESYLDTLKVDEEDVTEQITGDGKYTIAADNAQHTVVATDKAGNVSTYTVTVMKNYTVVFMADDTVVDTQTVGHGLNADLPEIPAKEGHDRVAPYWDNDGTNITQNTKISVIYTINKYNVTFFDGGETLDTITVEHNALAVAPIPPVKEGYIFCGWSRDVEGEIAWDIYADCVTEDIKLYAKRLLADGRLWCDPVAPQLYTGKALKPEVDVYFGTQLLELNKDYTVSYKNNTNVPVDGAPENKLPTITIKGKGNFTGTLNKTFTILPVGLASEAIIVDESLHAAANAKGQKPKVTVAFGTKKLSAKDMTVTYYPVVDGLRGEAVDTCKGAGTWEIVLAGQGNYTGERTILFTAVEPAALISKANITLDPKTFVYDGTEKTPAVTVKLGKEVLAEGTDYTVTYKNNVAVGTATVVVTGVGNYAGTKTATFKITGAAISKVQVEGIPKSVMYTGEVITLDGYSLFDKTLGVFLTEGEDYTVSYDKNRSKGTATILFTGINGYTGTLKKTFKIDAYDILKDIENSIKVEENIVASYMKGGAKPVPVITFNGKELVAGVDYTLAYKNNTAVADADSAKAPMITISGKGNFVGKLTVNFSIEAKVLSEVDMLVDDKAYTPKATGLPTVTLTDTDGKKLAAGKDYDKLVSYTYTEDVTLENGVFRNAGDTVDKKDIIPVGTVIRVTVVGNGTTYTGEASTTYRIVPQSLAKATVKVANQQYTGKPIVPSKEDITVTVNKVKVDPENFEIVSCTNNVNKGSATLTIRGVGENYGGVKTVKFKIDAKTMFWLFW